ncbi:MAG: phosphoribosylanthranilate isomerase [Gammaproteobacteria bacterium]|nr:phosphoribosylanthranilate isomerase [Gammaproteobacteria bacterium]
MSLLVKICGMATDEAINAAVAAGADAIGFVFHGPSLRSVEPLRAATLAGSIPAGILRVAVTLHPSQALVDRVLAEFLPDVWQSDAVDFEALHLPPTITCWPVWRSGASSPETPPPRLLFEAAESGAGARADWTAAARLAKYCGLILGGGLDAANVGAAIAAVRPYGVDVSSGVEREPGVKDPAMIRAFIKAARTADQGVTS